jgi:hypothetical protein
MRLSTKLLALVCLGGAPWAMGVSDAIKEFRLDERTVYAIPVAIDRVTTISFPGPITAIDAAQVTADNKSPASFQIAHSPGTSFLSIRALTHKAASNLNLRWNGKTYVLELVESPTPFYSVIFTPPPERLTGLRRSACRRIGCSPCLTRPGIIHCSKPTIQNR